MSLSLARPIVAEPGGLSGVSESGQDRLDHLGGQVADFGWRADRRRRHLGLRRKVHAGEPTPPATGCRRVAAADAAGPAGRRAGAVPGTAAGGGRRDTGATVPGRDFGPGGPAVAVPPVGGAAAAVRARPRGRAGPGDRHRRRLRRPAGDAVVLSDLETQLRTVGVADVDRSGRRAGRPPAHAARWRRSRSASRCRWPASDPGRSAVAGVPGRSADA